MRRSRRSPDSRRGAASPSSASPATAGFSSGTPAPRRLPASWWRARTPPSSTRWRGTSPTPFASGCTLSDQAADGSAGAAALARALIEREAPEEGSPSGPLLDLLFEKAIPASFNNAGPGFLAYIPGGGQPY